MLLTILGQSILLTLLASTAVAFDCTESNAVAWPVISDPDDPDSSDPCESLCNTQLCLQSCHGEKLQFRATLFTCNDNESCIFGAGILGCIDGLTGASHDERGGKGNFFQDAYIYTYANGQTTTFAAVSNILGVAAASSTTGLDPSASSITVQDSASTSTLSISVSSPVSVSTPSISVSSSVPTSTSIPISTSDSVSAPGGQTTIPVKASPTPASTVAPTTASPSSGGKRLGGWASSAYGMLGLVVGILVG